MKKKLVFVLQFDVENEAAEEAVRISLTAMRKEVLLVAAEHPESLRSIRIKIDEVKVD